MIVWTFLALLIAADQTSLTDEQKAELTQYFGFGPMEIYKIKSGINQLKLADLNKDGRTDVALWNPHQSRIEVFYQPDPTTSAPAAGAPPKLERNEVPNRGNMRNVNVPVAYRVAVMEIADLTGDGRPDIVFFGEPKELVILPGKAEGGFGPADSVRAPDGDARGGALAIGDFNRDGKPDVALLGVDQVLLFLQKEGGGLAKPVRLVHNIKQPLLMLAGDINHDGRDDLLVGSDEEDYGVYAWLQESTGALGPMRRIKVPKLRSMTICPAEKGCDLLGIEAVTGRLKHFQWETPKETATMADWPTVFYSYPIRSQSKRRPIAVGDVTGDKKADVVAVDPDAAQIILFEQTASGLAPGVSFPGLAKTLDVCVADVDGDGRNEVLSVSAEEKMIGISKFADGRLTFPTPLKIQGEPLSVAVGGLKVGDPPRLYAFVSKEKDKASMRIANLANGEEAKSWELAALDDEPSGMRFADVNQDGLNDLLLFVRFGALQTYLQKADGSFEQLKGPSARDGLVKEAPIEGCAFADVTGDGKPELLLAQKSFARALMVKDDTWTVVDQYNPESADAQITGLAALPAEPGSPTITLYDKKSRDLLILKRRADKTYAVAQTMPIGTFELTAMTAAPLAGDKHVLLMADAKTMVLAYPNEEAATLVEKHSYESATKDAWLMDSVVGDLNHDGIRDVAVVDGRKANIEVLTTLPNGDLVKATTFQVFQGKRFRDDPDSRGEPREVLIGDVTGDKIDDLVVVVHDRLIVYPGQ